MEAPHGSSIGRKSSFHSFLPPLPILAAGMADYIRCRQSLPVIDARGHYLLVRERQPTDAPQRY
jgi:hypothetical protein